MNQTLIIPDTWLEKVSTAVGLPPDEVRAMVERMWQYGASKAEIEQAMVMMAKLKGKSLLFSRSQGNN